MIDERDDAAFAAHLEKPRSPFGQRAPVGFDEEGPAAADFRELRSKILFGPETEREIAKERPSLNTGVEQTVARLLNAGRRGMNAPDGHVHGDERKPETGIEPSADNAIKASSAHIEIKLTDRKKIYSHGG